MYYNWYKEVLCRLEDINRSLETQNRGNRSNDIVDSLAEVQCSLDNVNCSMNDVADGQNKVYASLAMYNPMSVAAEYPSNTDNKLVYTTGKVRFLDMLNPKLVILFKGTLDTENPVYFSDTSGYEHIVTTGDTSHPTKGNEIVNNIPYQSLYVGNYIILNPSEDTFTSWMAGTIV